MQLGVFLTLLWEFGPPKSLSSQELLLTIFFYPLLLQRWFFLSNLHCYKGGKGIVVSGFKPPTSKVKF